MYSKPLLGNSRTGCDILTSSCKCKVDRVLWIPKKLNFKRHSFTGRNTAVKVGTIQHSPSYCFFLIIYAFFRPQTRGWTLFEGAPSAVYFWSDIVASGFLRHGPIQRKVDCERAPSLLLHLRIFIFHVTLQHWKKPTEHEHTVRTDSQYKFVPFQTSFSFQFWGLVDRQRAREMSWSAVSPTQQTHTRRQEEAGRNQNTHWTTIGHTAESANRLAVQRQGIARGDKGDPR